MIFGEWRGEEPAERDIPNVDKQFVSPWCGVEQNNVTCYVCSSAFMHRSLTWSQGRRRGAAQPRVGEERGGEGGGAGHGGHTGRSFRNELTRCRVGSLATQ